MPVRPWALVGIYYLILLVVYAARYHFAPIDFAHIGPMYAEHDPTGLTGYDGQFYYQIAKDPFAAYQFVDSPPYRYERVLFPLVVHAVALGQPSLVPVALLFVNWVSIVLGVAIVSDLLRMHGLSEWYSLAYGLFFGLATGLALDVAEPFTYALVALGIWLLAKRRVMLAALAMGLAGLARETAVLFPLAYLAIFVYKREWKAALGFALLGIGPLIAWLIAIVLIFGKTGLTQAPPFSEIPFGGIFYHSTGYGRLALLIILMLVPTVGALAFVFDRLRRGVLTPLLIAWALNALMLAFLAHQTYNDMVSCGRVAIGCVLAGVAYGATTRDVTVLKASAYQLLGAGIYAVAVLIGVRSFLL